MCYTLAAMTELSDDERAELREIFDHFDADSNGVIDRDEFKKLLRSMDGDMPDEVILEGLSALDGDANGVIDWDEFVEWWSAR